MTQPTFPDFKDRYGRKVTYLRVSITERCNFRCVYCMPAEGIGQIASKEYLSYDEIAELVEIFAAQGVTSVRITGGEPLVRADVPDLVAKLRAIDGIERIAMTTNGFLLDRYAQALKDAGLDSLNISLDTLDPERFKRITRVGDLDRVLQGIDAAQKAGFKSVKLNAVIVAGFNEDEMLDLVRFATERAMIMRFIEFMPIGDTVWANDLIGSDGAPQLPPGAGRSNLGYCVPAKTMRAEIAKHYRLEVDPKRYGTGPARYWRLHGPDTPPEGQAFGIIAAVTECFCDLCNRVRLTASGGLRACLADDDEINLRAPLRTHSDPVLRRAEIEERVHEALFGKKERHAFDIEGGSVTTKNMTSIGG
ncbi:GTP 3',8-cyclase MoaA [Bradymonas sediminis]|uniref:GTP 3',8-cyclase n=1 Tax=Bradymonas sediminis TaxID=1548548 RepID=A0A2Z4FMC3_9DELT|nr:GTP 3',8-cyclase MoaA [Bradymonas sediminis]AWV89906.1 GTP 3',8-cyclase MoaA [Bradymonas sediminis]TDP62007.1 cyclic pyranopterin monophosphate synthase subunit MoaA [Bradymonas sediminis]